MYTYIYIHVYTNTDVRGPFRTKNPKNIPTNISYEKVHTSGNVFDFFFGSKNAEKFFKICSYIQKIHIIR